MGVGVPNTRQRLSHESPMQIPIEPSIGSPHRFTANNALWRVNDGLGAPLGTLQCCFGYFFAMVTRPKATQQKNGMKRSAACEPV